MNPIKNFQILYKLLSIAAFHIYNPIKFKSMASSSKKSSLFQLLLLAALFPPSQSGKIAICWGQNSTEAPLADTCDSIDYGYVILSFLSSFGNGQTPHLNLTGHCDPNSNGCTHLSTDIKSCQAKGIKVFLSIGGPAGSYALASKDDARQLASYIWNNYLGGARSSKRPLGDAVLDGVNFDIEGGGFDHYDELADYLSAYSEQGRKVYLAAAPQCAYPDARVGGALDTGVFDYVWVRFYNNPSCEFSDVEHLGGFMAAWEKWTTEVKAREIFLGLPAAEDAAGSGFIPAGVLRYIVLPRVQEAGKYGGVMLWSKYYDDQSGYSKSIFPDV